jgi:CRISPR/Cas system Type II protein with McrA/HNH and RuvC-like nuclease domain
MIKKTKAVTFKLSEQEYTQLQEVANFYGQSKSEIGRLALDQYFDQLHFFKKIDVRIHKLEKKIGNVFMDENYLEGKFSELSKRDTAIYRAVNELIQIAKAGGEP